jgi:phosphoribosyl 1,2-cyclic phosphodiesterase
MSVFVRFWGTRGSIPTPGARTRVFGGNTSCVELRADDALFVCDGGTGLHELGLELARRSPSELTVHLLLSHTHWDHIQGFPFFSPVYVPATQLRVYEPAGNDRFHRLVRGQMRSEYFPVSFADLGASITSHPLAEGGTDVAGLRITHLEQTHPGRSYSYAFQANKIKVVYATDCELDQLLADPARALAEPGAARQLPAPLLKFAADADLLIADAQYLDEEYIQRAGWGHPRATTVVDWAVAAGVKRLALFHHDPMHSDEQVRAKVQMCQERAKVQGSKLEVFAAREGVELRF